MRISKKALSIPASMTLEVTAKVNQLKKEGKSIIGFTAGEPNFTWGGLAAQRGGKKRRQLEKADRVLGGDCGHLVD